jgi:beta,beta-carotene 9',10'-dioxygenase
MKKNTFQLGFGQTENEIQVDHLPIQGKFPDWLSGTLIRNGPGTFHVGDETYRHWFDGLAMLHKFTFSDGVIAYANRFLDTKSYRLAMDQGQIAYSEFATDPQWSFWDRLKNVYAPNITDSAKVNVAKIGEQCMALAETPIQVTFDPHTLATTGTFTYEDKLNGQMTTVHPQFDATSNFTYNLVTRFHQTSHYRIYQLENGRNPKIITSIPVNKPAYMHSFGMSENYFILTEFPLVVNSLALLFWLKPYIENYQWKPQKGTRITIINRHTGEVETRITSDPFFAFHHINAFETGDELIFDIDAYTDASILNSFYLDKIASPKSEIPFGKLRRYRINMKTKHVSYETLSDVCIELPVFDVARYNTSGDYRFIYAVSINEKQRSGFYNQLVKVDIQGKADANWYQPGCFPGEPIFVGRPGREREDDGVILSVVLDENAQTSFLLALDAETFIEIGRAVIPHAILHGYHGAFFDDIPSQREAK